ncbi:MAG: sigma-70 family RNA polymerase sigma factor [Archangium sp.]
MNAEGAVLEKLVASHREFLRFLERRLGGDRAQAEDVLQDAFVRSLPHAQDVELETAVAWFYRVLRNALIDRARRAGASQLALEKLTRELGDEHQPAPDTRDAICQCIGQLAGTLKPEYAQALSALEVEGQSVADFASTHGITTNNANVRVHRAREALKKQVKSACGTCAEHGCVDCTCKH